MCDLTVYILFNVGVGEQVLQQQTEAISRLGNVLKRDIRDMEIIMSEDTEMAQDDVVNQRISTQHLLH